jgi:putrescine transport system permease protein
MAVLPTIWILIFIVAPLLIILKTSLSRADFSIPPFTEVFSWSAENLLTIKLSLQNYITIIRDSYYIKTFINSIEFSGISTILCLTLGFAMAYGIYSTQSKFKNILLLLISLSFCTSFPIRIYAWINLLSAHSIINSTLIKLGIISSPIHFIGNYYAALLGMIFCYLPFMIFPIYTALQKLDKTYMEVAYDLSAGPIKTFWLITVPITKSGIISGCLMVFTASIGEFVIPELLGGADMNVFGRVLWNEFFVNLDWPLACALSIVMMTFVIAPIFMIQRWIEAK